jgi:hypothetical protein
MQLEARFGRRVREQRDFGEYRRRSLRTRRLRIRDQQQCRKQWHDPADVKQSGQWS